MSAPTNQIGRFFKHSMIYAVGNIINRIGAFLLLPIYTNYLTVAEYGSLELFYIVTSIISGFLAAGIAHSTLRFYFEYENIQDRHQLVITNYLASLVVTVIGVAIAYLFANPALNVMFGSDEYYYGYVLMLGIIVFELSSQVCLAYVRAEEHSIFFVVISIAKLLLQVGVNAYLVIYKDMGIVGVLFGNLAAVFAGWLILSVFVFKKCGFSIDTSKLSDVMKYAYPFLLATIVGVLAESADRLILKELVSLNALGLFALALKFSLLLEALIGEPFNRSYGSFRFSIMKDPEAPKIQERIVRYLVIALVIATSGLVYFMPNLLMIMSDENFWAASSLLPILALASAIKVSTYSCQTGFLYAKKSHYIFRISCFTAVCNITLSYFLIKMIGIQGACISQFLTALFVMILTHKLSQPFFRVSYDFQRIAVAILIGVLGYGVTLIIPETGFIVNIALKSLVLLVVIFSLLRSSILSTVEKIDLTEIVLAKFSINLSPLFGLKKQYAK